MQRTDNQANPLPKRALGRTEIAATPLVTHARIALPEVTRTSIEERLRRVLTPFGPRISHGSIRIEDINGPRGGPGLVCRVEIVFDHGERVQIEQRAVDLLEAVRRMIPRLVRRVRQHVERSGRKTPRPSGLPRYRQAVARAETGPTNGDGRPAPANGSSPQHDGSQQDSGMTYALEDSQGRPSRKSTRTSSNHIKAASQLTRRVRRKLRSPQMRAQAG